MSFEHHFQRVNQAYYDKIATMYPNNMQFGAAQFDYSLESSPEEQKSGDSSSDVFSSPNSNQELFREMSSIPSSFASSTGPSTTLSSEGNDDDANESSSVPQFEPLAS
jgi:hypothetical protein